MRENKDGKVKLVQGQNGGLNLRIPKNVAERGKLSRGDVAEITTKNDATLVIIKHEDK